MSFRGMSGCLRQAVLDAGLEKKIEVYDNTIYNDKYPNNERRFKWTRSVQKNVSKKEQKKYKKIVTELLAEHDLIVTEVSIWTYTGEITIYAKMGVDTKVENMRVKARELGYKLVKI